MSEDRPGTPVDYRWTMANERTLLAWLRTALTLVAAGLGVLQFLDALPHWLRITTTATLVLSGGLIAALAYPRAAAVQRAMEEGRRLPTQVPLMLVSTLIAALAVMLTIAVILTD